MKLFLCKSCQDVLAVLSVIRYCQCGESSAEYTDKEKASFYGLAMPLGIGNFEFDLLKLRRLEFAVMFSYAGHMGTENIELNNGASLFMDKDDLDRIEARIKERQETP